MHSRIVVVVLVVAAFFSVGPVWAKSKVKLVAPEKVAEMRQNREPVKIIEIALGSRSPAISGAQKVPMSKLDEWAKGVEKNLFIVAYCTCSKDQAAMNAARRLQSLGFTNVHLFEGGLPAWNEMVKARQQAARERSNQ